MQTEEDERNRTAGIEMYFGELSHLNSLNNQHNTRK